MATNLYRVRTGSTATTSGRELLDTLEQIAETFSRLKRIRLAMVAQKDGASDTASDYVTMSGMFGFTDAADVLSSQVAMDAFAELDSFVGTAGPSLEQCCSRLKQ